MKITSSQRASIPEYMVEVSGIFHRIQEALGALHCQWNMGNKSFTVVIADNQYFRG